MIPKKFLIGGTAAVGTVGTVAVVATSQSGFSSSAASQLIDPEKGDKPAIENTEQTGTNDRAAIEAANRRIIKGYQDQITNWLEEHKTETSNWKIEIEDVYGETKEFTEVNPMGLSDYLEEEKNFELLKSLSGETQTTFTFKKNENGDWENKLTEKQILAWVKNTSGGKATLKLADEEKQEIRIDQIDSDLDYFLNNLKDRKTVFEKITLTGSQSTKNILFEQYEEDGDWKHSKSEIDKWLKKPGGGNNKFEIKIRKEASVNTLDETDELELIGLFNYLDLEEDEQLLNYKSPIANQKVSLILEKNYQNDWELIHSEDTINNWVSNVSDKKAKLELYIGNSKQELSQIDDDDELNQLFGALVEKRDDDSDENNPFKEENLSGYDETSPKVIIFEKDVSGWKHIKEAIDDFLTENGINYTLQIQIKGTSKNVSMEVNDDRELIGLLDHLKNNENSHDNIGKCAITFEKKNDNTWKKISEEDCNIGLGDEEGGVDEQA